MKVCFKCKKKKEFSQFYRSKSRKDGHRTYCRECEHTAGILYREIHRKEIGEHRRERYRLNPKKKKQYEKDHKIEADARKKKYVLNHPEKRKEQARQWYYRNKKEVKERNNLKKDKINLKRKIYNQTHPQARIAHNLRTRINHFLGGRTKGGRLYLLIDCDMNFLKSYLESLFIDGMNWDNYGVGMDKWCIDHIIPLENFNLENGEEQKRAFHYTNMQPMWYLENASKSNHYIGKYKKL